MSKINDYGNADSNPYWTAAASGKLVFQQCSVCGHIQYPPRQNCADCWDDKLTWTESSGRGEIESFTIVKRSPAPAFNAKVPYVVVAVKTAEGPLMITNLIGEDVFDAKIGDPVEVAFEADSNGNVLPQFKRTEGLTL